MGMLQASSFNVRRTARVPNELVTVRRTGSQRIGPGGSKQLNPDRVVAPLDAGSEWPVIQQAITGNVNAQEHLFMRYKSGLYRTAYALLRNREDAEDALQDGFFSAFTKLGSFQGKSSFSSWLTRIVINAALMLRRRKNAHPESSLDEILEIQTKRVPRGAVDPRSDPEKIYAANEIKALIERQVRKLSPEMQQAYRLRAIKGLSTAESCRTLGIPESALKSRVFHARRKLANSLLQSA
jgi:RNA polymerase sigma-70 factor, ECF subfamily